ncbi:MAG: hypothetical protein U5L11_03225 [Arhodomonas sp.]|nr:hypothetical protein [Arhodomonas sp.]
MSRTFQNLQDLHEYAALENVMVGRHLRLDRRFLPALLRLPSVIRGDRACREKAAELMRFVGLEAYLDSDADAMPYGALKRLEIARALAAEPAACCCSMSRQLASTRTRPRRSMSSWSRWRRAGSRSVLVEHDMKLVMNISDHILVLNYGKKLAEGTAEEIRHNPEVISAYLGAA